MHEKYGYTAIRSAGSRGKYDIVAFHPGDEKFLPHWKLIQAKSHDHQVAIAMSSVGSGPVPPGTILEIWNKLARGFEVWRWDGQTWKLAPPMIGPMRPVSF